jgi:hypothetical protein
MDKNKIRICALLCGESIERLQRVLGERFVVSNPTRSFYGGDQKRWFPYLQKQEGIDADMLLLGPIPIAHGGRDLMMEAVQYARKKFPQLKVVVMWGGTASGKKEFLEAGAHLTFNTHSNDEKTLAQDLLSLMT